MAEASYKYNQDGRLPGTVKIGGWNQSGTLHEQPGSGAPIIAMTFNSILVDSDWAIYGIIDQLVWHVPGSKDPKGIALFGRLIGAPAEQNLVDVYADGGVTLSGMIPTRPEDALAVGFAYTGISNDVQDPDVSSGLRRTGSFEALLEVCYTAQLRAGWSLQPDFQYIWQPGGGVPEPSGKGTVPNVGVWGLRSTINF